MATINPRLCGYYKDPIKPCLCAPSTVTKYQTRISGLLLDRIDTHVEVPRVDYQKLSDDRLGEASELIRQRVERASGLQRRRFSAGKEPDSRSSDSRRTKFDALNVVFNADMRVGKVMEFCKLDGAGESLVRAAMGQMNLSAPANHRVHGTAPAGADDARHDVADLAGSEQIQTVHLAAPQGCLAKGLQYRPKIM